MAKYQVICEGPQGQPTFWNGVQLIAKGETIELDPNVVKVAKDSASLKPIGDAPVFEKDSAGKLVPVKALRGG